MKRKIKFPYQKRPISSKVLIKFKTNPIDLNNNNTFQHPSKFPKQTWESTFNLKNLKESYLRKGKINFDITENKFGFDPDFNKRRLFKNYLTVEEELRNKKMFEIQNGINRENLTPPKNKKNNNNNNINENYLEISKKNSWNKKSILEPIEYKEIVKRNSFRSKENSKNFLINNPQIKSNQGLIKNFYKTERIKKIVNEQTQFEREEMLKKIFYNFPSALRYKEVARAHLIKEMEKINKEKFKEITEKSKKDYEKNLLKKFDYYTDKEFFDKMNQIDKYLKENGKKFIKEYYEPLLYKVKDIKKEEKKIFENEHNNINNINNNIENNDNKDIDKKENDKKENDKNENEKNKNDENDDENKSKKNLSIDINENYNIHNLNLNISRYPISEYLSKEKLTNINILNDIENEENEINLNNNRNSNNNFINIYTKIAEPYVKTTLENKKINKEKYNIKYKHSGIYKLVNEDGKEYHIWSCCMKEERDAQGCVKIKDKKFKWNFY
jgi:hypothetical protein